MLNKDVGAASGGSVTIRMGSKSATSTILALGSGWVELAMTADKTAFFRQFNEASFDIEIEWSTPTSGYLLVDDVIFVPYDKVDGTYWNIRGKAATDTPWKVDDVVTFTDTGGAPTDAKIQWWLWVAGLGYLPSASGGSITFADP